RPADRERAVLRPRQPVPHGDLLSRCGTAPGGRGVEAAPGTTLRSADRHRDRAGGRVLSGRGVPPAVPRKEPGTVQVLSLELRPRPALARTMGQRCPGGGGKTVKRRDASRQLVPALIRTLAVLATVLLVFPTTRSLAEDAPRGFDPAHFHKPSEPSLRQALTKLQYEVTQQEGTEPPFKNEYWNNHQA